MQNMHYANSAMASSRRGKALFDRAKCTESPLSSKDGRTACHAMNIRLVSDISTYVHMCRNIYCDYEKVENCALLIASDCISADGKRIRESVENCDGFSVSKI